MDLIDAGAPAPRSRGSGDQPAGRKAVGVGLIALLGLVGLLAFAAGGSGSSPDGASIALPEVSPAVSPDDAAAATSQPSVLPRPTPTPRLPASPVPAGSLPELDASHIAVATRGNLQFLDLETGVWTRADLRTEVYEMRAVGGGVVVVLPSGSVVSYAPVEGGDMVAISDGSDAWLLGTVGELIVLHTQRVQADGAAPGVEARRVDGSLVWEAELPAGAWVTDSAGRTRLWL